MITPYDTLVVYIRVSVSDPSWSVFMIRCSSLLTCDSDLLCVSVFSLPNCTSVWIPLSPCIGLIASITPIGEQLVSVRIRTTSRLSLNFTFEYSDTCFMAVIFLGDYTYSQL
jgi:hypothetical protein